MKPKTDDGGYSPSPSDAARSAGYCSSFVSYRPDGTASPQARRSTSNCSAAILAASHVERDESSDDEDKRSATEPVQWSIVSSATQITHSTGYQADEAISFGHDSARTVGSLLKLLPLKSSSSNISAPGVAHCACPSGDAEVPEQAGLFAGLASSDRTQLLGSMSNEYVRI